MAKTKKNHPTACRGLNKTNCIFPCDYAEGKLEKQRSYCYSTIKRVIKHAKTEKEKKMLESKGKQITKKLNRAKQNMKKVNKDVKDAANETSIMSSITGFFTPSPKPKSEEPKPEVEEPKPEEPKPEEPKPEEPEMEKEVEDNSEPTTEIEPAVEEKKNE